MSLSLIQRFRKNFPPFSLRDFRSIHLTRHIGLRCSANAVDAKKSTFSMSASWIRSAVAPSRTFRGSSVHGIAAARLKWSSRNLTNVRLVLSSSRGNRLSMPRLRRGVRT